MKIGDRVYVNGYIDEIRYDDTKRVSTIIIRNEGGYFGTVQSEVIVVEQTEPQTVLEMVLNKQTDEDRRKMAESVRKAIKDEPQTTSTPYKVDTSSICKIEPQTERSE